MNAIDITEASRIAELEAQVRKLDRTARMHYWGMRRWQTEAVRLSRFEESRPVRWVKASMWGVAKAALGSYIAYLALSYAWHSVHVGVSSIDDTLVQLTSYVRQGGNDDEQMIRPVGRPLAALAGSPRSPKLTPAEVDAMIDHYAHIYEIDADTARGVLMQESSYREDAVSGDGGAHGMAQLRKQARDFCGITEAEAKDARYAIPCFFSWLSQKKHEQGGNDAEAVQSYYCGPSEKTCVNKPRGIGYLKSVVSKYGQRPQAPKIVEARR